MDDYDSTNDTLAHIRRVRELMGEAIDHLRIRREDHDRSKLDPPEKEAFDRLTPLLKDTEYGSDEYRSYLREMKPAIGHHYAHNDHHPEHWAIGDPGDTIADPWFFDEEMVKNGTAIGRMSLLALTEMLCDWKAAGERHATGGMAKSLDHNAGRFGIDPQLAAVLRNTARELGWLE